MLKVLLEFSLKNLKAFFSIIYILCCCMTEDQFLENQFT